MPSNAYYTEAEFRFAVLSLPLCKKVPTVTIKIWKRITSNG
jgi:hypothetical protein